MWIELRPILIGILLFALLNVGTTLVVTHSGLNGKFHRSMENLLPDKLAMLADAQPGILVLGTSQTNNDFDTADFDAQVPNGLTSFNLGLPGTRYDVMQANLEAYRRRYGNPRLLILEVSPTIMERNTR